MGYAARMRYALPVLTAAVLLAFQPAGAATRRPHDLHRRPGAFAQAERLIRTYNLLTPEQLACAQFERGTQAAGEVYQVSVTVRPDRPTCPGGAAVAAQHFDLFIDDVSGSYQWNGQYAATMNEIPQYGAGTFYYGLSRLVHYVGP